MGTDIVEFLARFPTDNGVRIVSAPRDFDGGEEEYDLHIGGSQRADLLRCGRGAWQLIAKHSSRTVTRILELGAGGGTCTLGLIAEGTGATVVVTDTSPKFLRMIDAKLRAAGISRDRACLVTLAGEDLGLLPDAAFGAVVIASALHHVDDWRAFLREAARVLTEGGVLVIQEPCREGNLMMAMILDVALSRAWSGFQQLPERDVHRLAACRDSIYFLANSTVEKVGEDKHSFLATDLAMAADAAGFRRMRFYSNAHFQDLADTDLDQHRRVASVIDYLDSFLVSHHRISPEAMAVIRRDLFPIFGKLDATYRRGDGPPLLACAVFVR